jgi:hypothetical protein
MNPGLKFNTALVHSALLFISRLWKIKLLLIQTRIVEKYFHVCEQVLTVGLSRAAEGGGGVTWQEGQFA